MSKKKEQVEVQLTAIQFADLMDSGKRGLFINGEPVFLRLPNPTEIADEGEDCVEDVTRACRSYAWECENELRQLVDEDEE